MSGDGGGEMTEAAPVLQLENEDLLADSFRRLPALPSSLLRASLVCKLWGRVVADPRFLREFHAHHRKAPLLGFFSRDRDSAGRVEFSPILDPPDRIPASRFSLQITRNSRVLHCRHGRLLIYSPEEQRLLVWDPVTGDLRRLALPPALDGKAIIDGGVVCASTEQGHVHGACHSDPFQVVVVAGESARYYGCAYSSETRTWGNLLSVQRGLGGLIPSPTCPSTMFRNSICLLLIGIKPVILQFDWARQNLALIDTPLDAHDFRAIFCGDQQVLITSADNGGLSFILLEVFSVQVWNRTMSHGDGVATWILGKTIELHKSLPLIGPTGLLFILGLDEDGNVLFKLTDGNLIMIVDLESMKCKKLPQEMDYVFCTPFSSFYTPGKHKTYTMQLQQTR
ncbi:hypothetical protein SETIT_9G292200v2 [Setaria italica]|uniref:F-box domain-containing protein n=1 Tax=Setaria italica TaxID=4555 RepID=A0A368SNN3_SETIT|nr:hypothetical protein SETIT_9G292200v2 [Setaria italica]